MKTIKNNLVLANIHRHKKALIHFELSWEPVFYIQLAFFTVLQKNKHCCRHLYCVALFWFVFSPNGDTDQKNTDQKNSEYGHLLRSVGNSNFQTNSCKILVLIDKIRSFKIFRTYFINGNVISLSLIFEINEFIDFQMTNLLFSMNQLQVSSNQVSCKLFVNHHYSDQSAPSASEALMP